MESFALLSNSDELFATLDSYDTRNCDSDDNQVDYSKCPGCNQNMSVHNNQYMCEHCGYIQECIEVADHMSITSDGNYNSIATGIRCIGHNAHRYQSVLRANSGSSESNFESLINLVLFGGHRISNSIHVPKEVLLAVGDQYRHVRSLGHIARGSIFRAEVAALTYYECLRQKLSYKPIDIYTYFKVDPSTYSKGDKKIRELLDHGHLDTNLREINAENSFLTSYCTSLRFSETHVSALLELLDFVVLNKIINPGAKSSTRALAVLSFFLTAIKYPMTSTEFENHFKCNFGSVRTLSLDMVQQFESIRPIFEKHNIAYEGIARQIKRAGKRKVKKGIRIALD